MIGSSETVEANEEKTSICYGIANGVSKVGR
jgi:hypothetical protein